MAASENVLNQLHEFFAEYLLGLMTRTTEDEDGNPVPIPVSAAELGVIAKFLKDNNVTFAGDDDDADLQAFRQRAADAARDAGFSKQDLEESIEGLNFRSH